MGTDEKIFTIEEQYNNQNNKIYAQMSLEVHSGCRDAITPPTSWFGGKSDTSYLQERGETGVHVYQEDVVYRGCETA
jgi:hypothetical protein